MTETKHCVRAHVRTIASQHALGRAERRELPSVCSATSLYVNGLFSQLLLTSEPPIVVCTHYLWQTGSRPKKKNTTRAPASRVTLLSPKKHVPPSNVTNGTEAMVFLAGPDSKRSVSNKLVFVAELISQSQGRLRQLQRFQLARFTPP